MSNSATGMKQTELVLWQLQPVGNRLQLFNYISMLLSMLMLLVQ